MRCAVFDCKANNNKGSANVRYYCFPKDATLRKKWIRFCRQNDDFNPSTGRVCSAHFTADDFERNLQFEMGFCKNNAYKLKKGIVPSVPTGSKVTISARDIRMQTKTKKRMVANLLANTTVAIDDPKPTDDIVVKTNQEEIIRENSTDELNQKITILTQEVEDLRRDKSAIQEKEKSYKRQIVHLKKKIQKSELERANMERRLREIFTQEQVDKLKNGTDRMQWSKTDTSQSITLYTTIAQNIYLSKSAK